MNVPAAGAAAGAERECYAAEELGRLWGPLTGAEELGRLWGPLTGGEGCHRRRRSARRSGTGTLPFR